MLKIIVTVILIAVVVALIPLAGIWALNTLFATGIAYTFKTWLAMLIVSAYIGASKK